MKLLVIFSVISAVVSGAVADQNTHTECPQQGVAGGGLPTIDFPDEISKDGLEQLRLANSLQRLEVAFFKENVPRLEGWVNAKNSSTSIRAMKAISAVSFHLK